LEACVSLSVITSVPDAGRPWLHLLETVPLNFALHLFLIIGLLNGPGSVVSIFLWARKLNKEAALVLEHSFLSFPGSSVHVVVYINRYFIYKGIDNTLFFTPGIHGIDGISEDDDHGGEF